MKCDEAIAKFDEAVKEIYESLKKESATYGEIRTNIRKTGGELSYQNGDLGRMIHSQLEKLYEKDAEQIEKTPC